jgi:hypothetical protein
MRYIYTHVQAALIRRARDGKRERNVSEGQTERGKTRHLARGANVEAEGRVGSSARKAIRPSKRHLFWLLSQGQHISTMDHLFKSQKEDRQGGERKTRFGNHTQDLNDF